MLPLLSCLDVAAQSNSAISQQYQTTHSDVTPASLVEVEMNSTNTIRLATADTSNRLAGVVGAKSLIELSNGKSGVQVVTSGLTLALVSDLNGSIATGDRITASPIAGIGMKATGDAVIVGTAQGDLSKVKQDTRTIKDKQGRSQTVHIGLVAVQVNVAFYSVDSGKASSYVPAFLQSLANNVSGHNVSETRVLIAALVLLLLFFGVAALLYSSVRSSITAIGRNPLSAHAVRKSLFEVGLTVLALLIFCTIIIYVILTA